MTGRLKRPCKVTKGDTGALSAHMLHRRLALLVILLLAGTAVPAAAEETRPIRSGTAGQIAVPFSATNAGPERMACSAAVAHWYSVDLGEAAAGETVAATLWFDPASGEITILNASEDRMPVQALWCGVAGRSWETRSAVPLARKAGSAPGPIRLVCSSEGEQLACR